MERLTICATISGNKPWTYTNEKTIEDEANEFLKLMASEI